MGLDNVDIVAVALDAVDTSAGPPLAAKEALIWQPDAEPDHVEAPSVPSLESVSPLVEHLAPVVWAPPARPANLAAPGQDRLGGAFSFMCTLRMDGIDNWSRVFDFSLNADEDSITAGAIEQTNDLHFTVFRGRKPFSVRVNDFFVLGQESVLLCTVSASGHMRVYKDGLLVGENKEGMSPLEADRPRMFVGGHYLFHDQAFRGIIKDVKVWNQEVSWPPPGILSSTILRRASGTYVWVDWIPPTALEKEQQQRDNIDQAAPESAEGLRVFTVFPAMVSTRRMERPDPVEAMEQPDPEPPLPSDLEAA